MRSVYFLRIMGLYAPLLEPGACDIIYQDKLILFTLGGPLLWQKKRCRLNKDLSAITENQSEDQSMPV